MEEFLVVRITLLGGALDIASAKNAMASSLRRGENFEDVLKSAENVKIHTDFIDLDALLSSGAPAVAFRLRPHERCTGNRDKVRKYFMAFAGFIQDRRHLADDQIKLASEHGRLPFMVGDSRLIIGVPLAEAMVHYCLAD